MAQTAAKPSSEPKEQLNAKQFPKIYYCRHMVPGVCGYKDENILIDADVMKASAPSFVGKPIYVHHQKVSLDSLEEEADGYVVDCFYNPLDGWLWAKMLITSDEGQRAIERKWSVSNAYVPGSSSGAGQWLNIDYDRKIGDYSFTHLAIVPNPRYEEAKIFSPDEYKAYNEGKEQKLKELQNSKPLKGHPMIKFFQKKQEELTNGLPADADLSTVEVEVDGKRVTLEQMINAVKKNDESEKAKAEEEEKKNKKPMLNDDTEVCVGDEKMPMKTLMNKYNAAMKKNAEDDAEAKKAEEKKNAEKAEEEKKKEEEKTNALKKIAEVTNASHKQKAHAVGNVETSADKTARGAQRYGSAKK